MTLLVLRRLSLVVVFAWVLPIAVGAAEPAVVQLAKDGKPLHSIVVASEATPRVQAAAKTLAGYLERISGAAFRVVPGDGTTGIAVGKAADFPALRYHELWDSGDPTLSEDYLLESHSGGLHAIGASDLAVEHAVWDLLYRLGHRQFFPGETWEVVPSVINPRLQVSTREHPAYYARRIWYGYGPWDYAAEPYQQWCARNRATSGISLHSGHAYDGILHRNQKEFREHPEYLGLVDGQRKSTKFCISNPGLRRLVAEDAQRQLAADPAAMSVSIDPSDGGGWCQCADCQALGSVSDRAVTLANEVAQSLEVSHGNKFVGMYAYNEHSPPPSIRVHPRVVISVATAFIRGGYTVDQLMDGWHRQGATLGIREYYNVHTWSRDLPGAARGSNLTYLHDTIPHFHAKGGRFLSAESGDGWGPDGLGYYLAARMLWDVREADRLNELREDFLQKAFGDAQVPMDQFYRLIDGSRRPLLSDDLIGRMYRQLEEARRATADRRIQRRLDDLVLYTRYLELWTDYSTASGDERQTAFETLIRHGYRMRKTMMIHAKALYRDVAARDKSVSIPPEASWQKPEPENPWKNSEPFTSAELNAMLAAGIERRRLLDFETIAFSDELVPVDALKLPAVASGSISLFSRGVRNYYTWIKQSPGAIELGVTAGNVYQNRGEAKLSLYPAGETLGAAVAQSAVAPDRQEHVVHLKSEFTGLQRIQLSDAGAGTRLSWPDGQPLTIAASAAEPASFVGRWSLYFYVPRGTKTIGGYSNSVGAMHDPSGRAVFTFTNKPGYFSVPVPPGQDGRLWKFHQCAGERILMTVPPYLARNERELLLPREVVQQDRQN